MEYYNLSPNVFHPKYLWRDDGERVTLNEDGSTYSFDFSEMFAPYKYSYEVLLSAGFLLNEPFIRKNT